MTTAGPASAADPVRLRVAVRAAVDFYRRQLTGPAGGPARTYLRQRGLQPVVDRAGPWQIGYAPPGWQNLARHLQASGYTAEELVAAGLCRRQHADPGRLLDVFRDRLMFPVRDQHGPVGFTGRAAPGAGPDTPKYLNTAQTPLYDKSQLLFGLAEQQDRLQAGWQPALVEGPTDVLAVWLSYSRDGDRGIAAVAACGTALTPAQAEQVSAVLGAQQHGVVTAYDNDPAGRAATDRAWSLLHARLPSRLLHHAVLPAGADPATLLTRPDGRVDLRDTLQAHTQPLLETVVNHRLDTLLDRNPRLLDDVGGRVETARHLVTLMFDADDKAEAIRIGALITQRTGISVQALVEIAVDYVEASWSEAAGTLNSAGPAPPASQSAFPPLRPRGMVASQPSPATARATHPTRRR
ncbi:DNA primase [Actinoplanes sp. SE50]|uniref:toprim domain-containing protein n=1 Tax=unclassified Actinoplanes TaxID=2626549 RepID=UPI00023EBC0C|nr:MULTISPECIES: toprim domain-containing protein [unclassified Actinoplanes]AEV86827.1 DNA primase [Actinoplanes sp. SE50/110]ATO85224.1 DNA primase [Actinoplanes sp. SE50]SLM02634.1 DNA primase [Actinoplanes sp. SE50/110]